MDLLAELATKLQSPIRRHFEVKNSDSKLGNDNTTLLLCCASFDRAPAGYRKKGEEALRLMTPVVEAVASPVVAVLAAALEQSLIR